MADSIIERGLIIYDPLTETTRKERTSLLGVAMLGIALVSVPLVPEKLSAFGVDFSKVNQAVFVRLYSLVVAYYLAAFCIYAFTDYIAWRRREVIQLHEYTKQQKVREASKEKSVEDILKDPTMIQVRTREGDFAAANPAYHGFAGYWLGYRVARVRAVFEFTLPIAVACYALWALHSYVPTKL